VPDARGPGTWLRSVRVRLTLAAVVTTAVAVTSAGWLLIRSVEDTQTARVRDEAEVLLDRVVDRLEGGTPPSEALADAMDAPAQGDPSLVGTPTFIEVIDEDGETEAAGPMLPSGPDESYALSIAGTGGSTLVGTGTRDASQDPGPGGEPENGGGEPPSDDTEDPPAGSAAGSNEQDGAPDGDQDLVSQQTLVAANTVFAFEPQMLSRTVATPSGDMTVYAAAPVDELQENLAAVRRALWIGLPLLVAAVAAVAWHLVGRSLRPVEAIRAEVAAIGGTTMHRRVPTPDTDDEIGRLAHTMNGMLDRLEAAATRQRQFVSDASHELRSPVAAIRTDVEVALREGDRADWQAVGAAVLAEEARLERLLDDLLVLAAADEASGTRAADERVDVHDLVADVAARPRRVPVRWSGNDGDAPARPAGPANAVAVAGRSDHLARLLTNLVDNAARHAATAVDVGVELAESPTGSPVVHLVVDDDGPGVPVADRQRVFARFTRLDDGRARDRGGAGLGLAVVRSIAVGHRGRVWIDDAPAGGARFIVELPVVSG
jgi:signal transduction histidine kinase